MTHEQPSPDGSDLRLPNSLARVEDSLRSRQPRPVSWNAEAIVRGAMSANDPVEPPGQRAAIGNSRRRLWAAMVGVWMGGAVAGSLLTAHLLGPAVGRKTVDNPEIAGIASAGSRQEAEDLGSLSQQDAREAGDVLSPGDDEELFPRWSASEFLVSSRILSFSRLASGSVALRAGSYVRPLSVTPGTGPASGSTVSSLVEADFSTDPESDLTGQEHSPTSAVDRNDLLRELLGDGPVSAL